MTITYQTIISLSAVLTSLFCLGGTLLKIHKWYLRQEVQDQDIARIKEENTLICFGLSACLDGMQQLCANNAIFSAKEKLDKYLNQQAHK